MDKPNKQELIQVSRKLGLEIEVLDDDLSKDYIKRVIKKFKPYKTAGHLAIGVNSRNIALEKYEFSYSKYLNSEPAFIFFDQEGLDRNTVVIVKDAQLVGDLMENSFGMEYFLSNEKMDYLIAVNWYVIEVSDSAVSLFSNLDIRQEDYND
ncbi:hypothetical protein [Paenibacillus tarimensis]|uniref:hypothetical protein n=1 Tax=Paenibacillus tarimensis TaxID=416012 RepID=UPI0039EEE789